MNPKAVRNQAIRRKIRGAHAAFYQRLGLDAAPRETPLRFSQWLRARWALSGSVIVLALLAGIGIPAWASVNRHETASAAQPMNLPLALPPAPAEPSTAAIAAWQTVEVEPGQTLSGIFAQRGLAPTELARVMASGKQTGALKTLHPGDRLGFLIGTPGQLAGFRYQPDLGTLVTLTPQADGSLGAQVTQLPVERRMRFGHGNIDSSLFAAGDQAGLSEVMVLKLADVFKFDIDFIKDLQRGDEFTVVYDDVYRNGQYVQAGDIIAAEFVNHGRRYTAYRFQRADGSVDYYTEDGRPLRKTLLRTPVSFSRISSRFGMRHHPILGYNRAHQGVDYAAPTGTPIHAAGDGTITFRGKERGYGNFITIRNGSAFTTAYGHMSRFAAGLKVGSHVTQGEVIGYVGQTGLATGPHLHYEVRVNGRAMNPLTVTLPKPKPLTPTLMAEFQTQITPMVARIHLIDQATRRLAQIDAHHDGGVRAD